MLLKICAFLLTNSVEYRLMYSIPSLFVTILKLVKKRNVFSVHKKITHITVWLRNTPLQCYAITVLHQIRILYLHIYSHFTSIWYISVHMFISS